MKKCMIISIIIALSGIILIITGSYAILPKKTNKNIARNHFKL